MSVVSGIAGDATGGLLIGVTYELQGQRQYSDVRASD